MKNNINQQLGRPRIRRRIRFCHKINYFKPRGIPMRDLKIVELSIEELEVLRLKNIEDLDQTECAKKMNTSQSTFQRILNIAYKKISIALVEGMVIKISDINSKK
ncbi:MAG: DUF134 domain-containing protein [Patescibacteria group bacterium]|nr:DUF134 domain-containing protein [Patescibacteria group bacterium]